MSKRGDPILIAAPTRCGTTMLAALLMYHGVWIGKAKATRAVHTNSLVGTENTAIKKYLKKLNASQQQNRFKEDILGLVETEDRWLLKTAQTLLKWKLFYKSFPQARWVLPTRPTADIVASAMRHPAMQSRGAEEQRKRARMLKHLQKEVSQNVPYYLWVEVDKVANRDRSELQKIFDFCEVEPDFNVCDEFIDPSMWRRASRGE